MDIRKFFGASTSSKNKEKGAIPSEHKETICPQQVNRNQETGNSSKLKNKLNHKFDLVKSHESKHSQKVSLLDEDNDSQKKPCNKLFNNKTDKLAKTKTDKLAKTKHKKEHIENDIDDNDKLPKLTSSKALQDDAKNRKHKQPSENKLTIDDSSDEDHSNNSTAKKNKSQNVKNLNNSTKYKSNQVKADKNKDRSSQNKSKTQLSFSSDDDDDEAFKRQKSKKANRHLKFFDSDSDEEEDPLIPTLKQSKKKAFDSDEDPLPPKLKKSKETIFDSDEDPLPPKLKKSKEKIFDSEDEEDIVVPKRKKSRKKVSDEESSKLSKSPSDIQILFQNQTVSQKKKKKDIAPKLIATSIADFFGTAPIQRSCRNTVATKRKNVEVEKKPMNNTEKGIHEDEDFEATVDAENDCKKICLNEKYKKDQNKSPTQSEKTVLSSSHSEILTVEHSKESPVKMNQESNGLASKLALRVKAQKEKEVELPSKPVKEEKAPLSKGRSTEIVSPSKNRTHLKSAESPTFIKETQSRDSESTTKVKKEDKKLKNSQSKDVETVKSENGSPSEKDKKRASFLSYQQYKSREGPQALGSKEIPEGAENCMEGMTFVITGVLESLERDQAKELIERHGGKVTQNVSKNTTYVVVGREPGPAKLEKAATFSTKKVDEDGLLELVRNLPGKISKYDPRNLPSKSMPKVSNYSDKGSQELVNISPKPSKVKLEESLSYSSGYGSQSQSPMKPEKTEVSSLMWVDKYKPQTLKQIIGQQGEKSCANKLLHWLRRWHKNNRNENPGKKAGFFNKLEDGSNFKAALLSGPPGIGKTTTASLVCQELGFTFIELNASDTRSKKSLKQEVAEALNSHSLSGFFSESVPNSTLKSNKHALLMDEIDGMAGNEDRGGIQEVISLIKNTKIPIICMCNDRSHPKIRSLVNYCFDLRFQKPRIEQIKGPIMSIAFKEGLKIPPPALQEIIIASNHDIRQILHNLCVWSAKEKALTYNEAKANAQMAKKDIKMGPFDVARKVFIDGQETSRLTIHDKSDLFFHDYSIAPLFVQENYIMVQPFAARGDVKKHLKLLSQTADSICDGDLVDKLIRTNGSWNLLPTEAIFASVIPGEVMRGSIPQMINFPSWLGKNSRQGKVNRILQELHLHSSLRISGSKLDLNLDYLYNLKNRLTEPLVKYEHEGINSVLDVMKEYSLLREDFDNIVEIALWPEQKSPFASINTKVKAAFTRAYNKEGHCIPFSTTANVKKGHRGTNSQEEEETYEMEETTEELAANPSENDSSDNDLESDRMIKIKKKPAAKKSKDNIKPEGTSKGKGRGKGKR